MEGGFTQLNRERTEDQKLKAAFSQEWFCGILPEVQRIGPCFPMRQVRPGGVK